jgi:hypothetical protein
MAGLLAEGLGEESTPELVCVVGRVQFPVVTTLTSVYMLAVKWYPLSTPSAPSTPYYLAFHL